MPTSPSPPTSRVGFLLIRTSLSSFRSSGPGIVVLLVLWSLGCRPLGPGLSSFGSWVCRPFGPWVLGLSSFRSLGPGIVVLLVLGLLSFGSYGPWVVVVLMVLRMDSCRCVECSVLRRKEGKGKKWRHGLLI